MWIGVGGRPQQAVRGSPERLARRSEDLQQRESAVLCRPASGLLLSAGASSRFFGIAHRSSVSPDFWLQYLLEARGTLS